MSGPSKVKRGASVSVPMWMYRTEDPLDSLLRDIGPDRALVVGPNGSEVLQSPWKPKPIDGGVCLDVTAKQVADRLRECDLFTLAKAIAAQHGVAVEAMLGERRFKAPTAARHELWSEIREQFPRYSWPDLGRMFGRRHDTIRSGVKKARAARSAA